MLNDNKQQQSVILKGIAQQLLTMQMPTFDEANKLLASFSVRLVTEEEEHRQSIIAALAANEKTVYFCYECEGPNKETLRYKVALSWEKRNPETMDRLVALESVKRSAFTTTSKSDAEHFINNHIMPR